MKKKNNYQIIGLSISALAFIFYAANILFLWYPQWQDSKHLAFNWPDANANFWSVQRIVKNFSIGEFDGLNIPGDNLLHTRSQNVIEGVTLPMTFLPSLFVLASLSWCLGLFSSLLLVSLLAAATLYIFHLLVLKLLKNEKAGIISISLLASLAPWAYFAAQPLLPNIIVIFFAILSLYLFLENKYLAGSLFFALAIVCRPPEIIWLAPLLLLFFYYLRPRIAKIRILNSAIIFVAIMIWALYLNKTVFGGYFLTGYSNFQANNLPSEINIASNNIFSWLFPFGLNLLLAVKNYIKYFWLLIWPYSIFIVLGMLNILRQQKNIIEKRYLIVYVVLSALLVLYYGSWDFADPLVKNLNTISISYVRYFLPIFIMSIPLVVLGLDYLVKNLQRQNIWRILISSALILFSLYQFYFTTNDGWLAVSRYVRGYYTEYQAIKKIAPPGSVIISERSDKYLYPYYRVVGPQGDLPVWPRIKNIHGVVEVYFYSNQSVEQIESLRQTMSSSQLDLSVPILIKEDFNLYQVIRQ